MREAAEGSRTAQSPCVTHPYIQTNRRTLPEKAYAAAMLGICRGEGLWCGPLTLTLDALAAPRRSPLFWRAVLGEFVATTLFLYITITVRTHTHTQACLFRSS